MSDNDSDQFSNQLNGPLLYVPQMPLQDTVSRSVVVFYGIAGRLIIERDLLTYKKAVLLYRDVMDLENLSEQVKHFKELGVMPQGKTAELLKSRKDVLIEAFKRYQLKPDDFIVEEVPHPENIDFNFIGV